MILDVNNLSLWHGTSGHLIPSIREYGLGGKNPLPELGVLEFLSESVQYLDFDKMNFGDPEHTMKSIIFKAERQCGTGMNFKHGHLYVTVGRSKAESYAKRAPEIVDIAQQLIRLVPEHCQKKVLKILENYPLLSEFLAKPNSPVVIKIRRAKIDWLTHESGDELDLERMLNIVDETVQSVLFDQMAFRLNHVVQWSDLQVQPLTQE